MQHSFDIDIAKEYGILEAILLNNLWFWIEKNRANNINYYDGYYWTYNSTRAFNELFPYVSQRQIQCALKRLIEEEILQTGNYNKVAYDRTLWYAFTEKGKCIMQKCKMEDAKMLNGLGKKDEPIPDIKPNDEPDSKPKKKESKKTTKTTSYDEIINSKVNDDDIKELLYEFIKMRTMKKKPLTDRALTIQINKLSSLSPNIEIQKKIIEKTIVKCWDEFYPYKEENNDFKSKERQEKTFSNPFMEALKGMNENE